MPKDTVLLLYWDHRYNKPQAFNEKAGPWTVMNDKRLRELEYLGFMSCQIKENSDQVLNS